MFPDKSTVRGPRNVCDVFADRGDDCTFSQASGRHLIFLVSIEYMLIPSMPNARSADAGAPERSMGTNLHLYRSLRFCSLPLVSVAGDLRPETAGHILRIETNSEVSL